jgi:hypothetical protein
MDHQVLSTAWLYLTDFFLMEGWDSLRRLTQDG